jgi:hypothetical protein
VVSDYIDDRAAHRDAQTAIAANTPHLGIAAVVDAVGRVKRTSRQVIHARNGNKKLCEPWKPAVQRWLDPPAGSTVTCPRCRKRLSSGKTE